MNPKKLLSKSLILTAAGAVTAMGMASGAQAASLALWDSANNGATGAGGDMGPASGVIAGATAANAKVGPNPSIYVNLFGNQGAYFGDGTSSAADEATIFAAGQFVKVSLSTSDASPTLNFTLLDMYVRHIDATNPNYWVYAGAPGFTPTVGSSFASGTLGPAQQNAHGVAFGYGWDNPITSDATLPTTVDLSSFTGVSGLDVYMYFESGNPSRVDFGGAQLEGTLGAVPEPASLVLLGLGGLLLMPARRKNRT